MGKLADIVFFRRHPPCPRWMCFTFDNRFRRMIQNPRRIIGPFVREGDVVLDVGPGIGYFTIEMAKIVGTGGKVIAADIQEPMLRGIEKRARRAGVRDRIELHLATNERIYAGQKADFILAFWMVHEVRDSQRFFNQLREVLKPTGRFLLAEPKLHVSSEQFYALIDGAGQAGFFQSASVSVPLSHAALFFA